MVLGQHQDHGDLRGIQLQNSWSLSWDHLKADFQTVVHKFKHFGRTAVMVYGLKVNGNEHPQMKSFFFSANDLLGFTGPWCCKATPQHETFSTMPDCRDGIVGIKGFTLSLFQKAFFLVLFRKLFYICGQLSEKMSLVRDKPNLCKPQPAS